MKLFLTFLFLIIFCFQSNKGFSENITFDDLLIRNGVFYKKFSDTPFTGDISGESKTLKNITVGKVKNGKPDGKWLGFYKSGQLKTKIFYKDGKEDGPSKSYYQNGQLKKEGTFKDDKEDGLIKSYDENGQLESEETYIDGEFISRKEIYYHQNGQLKYEETWKYGKLIDSKEY